MIVRGFRLGLILATALGGGPALAQMAPMAPMEQPQCTAPAALPALFATWRSPVALAAAGSDKATAQVTPGQAATLALLPTPAITYPVQPAKPGTAESHGGLVRLVVRQAGVWRVALGAGAWVDVVKDGTAARSIAHAHGPDCSGIRKMVDYQLDAGVYTLEIAGSADDKVTLLATRLP